MLTPKCNRHLAILAFILLPCMSSNSFAQQVVDCSSGNVSIPDDGISIVINGYCKEVILAGNGNTIRAGDFGTLRIMGEGNKLQVGDGKKVVLQGGKNTVAAGNVDYARAQGSDNILSTISLNELLEQGSRNTTTYQGSTPKVTTLGDGNKHSQGSGAQTGIKPATKQATKRPAKKSNKASTVSDKMWSKYDWYFPGVPGHKKMVKGKWIKSLPNGYRIKAKTINYWTNRSMTATRTIHLTFTEHGQFEMGVNAISGGDGVGVVGAATSSNKKGGTGLVGGANSTGIIKREGLDPSKYGAYYISGRQITFTYANGKQKTESIKIDGQHELVIGKKRYFVKGTIK